MCPPRSSVASERCQSLSDSPWTLSPRTGGPSLTHQGSGHLQGLHLACGFLAYIFHTMVALKKYFPGSPGVSSCWAERGRRISSFPSENFHWN